MIVFGEWEPDGESSRSVVYSREVSCTECGLTMREGITLFDLQSNPDYTVGPQGELFTERELFEDVVNHICLSAFGQMCSHVPGVA